ncbi:MAG: NAD(P)-dependent oxidoreductase [Victivallaceae bacterium]|nr:NAD(P)-dependent oxidoreductase [Victivallaceae bacterium]
MKLLLTGVPGFLGTCLKKYFIAHGWSVDSMGLTGDGSDRMNGGQHFICDLSANVPEIKESYDLVIHAAGKAHVLPRTAAERQSFYDVNVTGTQNLLRALEPVPPRSIVFISSVAVYGAQFGERISESAPLNAVDPYGKSKIMAEEAIRSWEFSRPVSRGIVRLPLIAGPNAPGNLGSMLGAMKSGRFFNIGDGRCRRSVISVYDIAPFIEVLSEKGGIYNLTDTADISFRELYSGIRQIVSVPYRPNLPRFIAYPLALVGEFGQIVLRRTLPFNLRRYRQMTMSLTFDGTHANNDFKWKPERILTHLDILLEERTEF